MMSISLKQSLLWFVGFAGSSPLGSQFSPLLDRWHLDRLTKKIRKRKTASLLILNYHRVLPEHDPFAIDALSVKEFESQIRLLKAQFHVRSLEDAITALRNGNLARNTMCLTFDDGYRDNYDCAFPILEKYNLPATIFLTTNVIGTKNLLWHDQVLAAFEQTKVKTLDTPKLGIKNLPLVEKLAKRDAAFLVLEKLKKYAPQQRDEINAALVAQLKTVSMPHQRMMLNWDEIKTMSNRGIRFGAHTHSHPILATLDDAAMRDEIITSKNIIEDNLGKSVTTFAYPNGRVGDYDDRVISILDSAGFDCAVTTNNGINTVDSPHFELSRIAPWDQNSLRFYGRLLLQLCLD